MKKGKRDWAKIIKDHRDSGKSVKDFCHAKGIHPNTFYKYRKLYSTQPFIEVSVSEHQDVAPIVLRVGRYSLRIQSGFDRDCLKSVLEVIGGIE